MSSPKRLDTLDLALGLHPQFIYRTGVLRAQGRF